MVLCLAALMAVPAAAETDITGTWIGTEINANGVIYQLADYSFTFNPDGSLAAFMKDQEGNTDEAQGTWSLNGDKVTVAIDSDTEEMTIADGKLNYGSPDGSITIILSREGSAASASSAVPQTIRATSKDVFYGDWKICALYFMDTYVTADQFAALGFDGDVTLQIREDSVAMTSAGETVEYKSGFSLMDYALAVRTGETGENNMTTFGLIKMTDQGLITMTVNMGDTKVGYYFAKQ